MRYIEKYLESMIHIERHDKFMMLLNEQDKKLFVYEGKLYEWKKRPGLTKMGDVTLLKEKWKEEEP
ncbi:MAG: hypothetical protein ACRC5C_13195 [Bacilli bacterium]